MPFPVPNTQIVAQGIARLTSAYLNQPNCRALLAVYLQPFQDLEDAAYAVLTGRVLATAQLFVFPETNEVLDEIGDIVGQPRVGLSDAAYQSLIYLRIAVNRSIGRTTDWSRFASILLRAGATGPVGMYEDQAGFVFWVFDLFLGGDAADPQVPNVIASVLARAVPNGVAGGLVYSTWATGNDLAWADANNLTTTGEGTWSDYVSGSNGGVPLSAATLA